MRWSEPLRRGLHRRAERLALVACLALAAFYPMFLAAVALDGDPIDRQFARRRDAARIELLKQHRVPLGQTIALSEAGQPGTPFFLLDGWSTPEPTGVWSVAPVARLLVLLPMAQPNQLSLSFSAAINLNGEQQADVAIWFGDRSCFEIITADLSVSIAKLDIPSDAVGADGTLIIGFGSTPHGVGGADGRKLGLMLMTILIAPLPQP